jgi:hypothetical protein
MTFDRGLTMHHRFDPSDTLNTHTRAHIGQEAGPGRAGGCNRAAGREAQQREVSKSILSLIGYGSLCYCCPPTTTGPTTNESANSVPMHTPPQAAAVSNHDGTATILQAAATSPRPPALHAAGGGVAGGTTIIPIPIIIAPSAPASASVLVPACHH